MKSESLKEFKMVLLEKYKYRTELHAHTSPVSSCADFSPEKVVKTYADLGYTSLAIVNHYTYDYRFSRFENEVDAGDFVEWYMKDFYEAKKAGEKYGINVILGAEIRFAENFNDYLVFGINEEHLLKIFDALPLGIAEFKKNKDFGDILIIQAHPNRNGMEEIDSSCVDGMEIFNMHAGHNSRNALTIRKAKENKVPVLTIGSDYHHEGGEGLCAIRTKEPIKDSFELARILKSKDYIFDILEDTLILP